MNRRRARLQCEAAQLARGGVSCAGCHARTRSRKRPPLGKRRSAAAIGRGDRPGAAVRLPRSSVCDNVAPPGGPMTSAVLAALISSPAPPGLAAPPGPQACGRRPSELRRRRPRGEVRREPAALEADAQSRPLRRAAASGRQRAPSRRRATTPAPRRGPRGSLSRTRRCTASRSGAAGGGALSGTAGASRGFRAGPGLSPAARCAAAATCSCPASRLERTDTARRARGGPGDDLRARGPGVRAVLRPTPSWRSRRVESARG